MLKEEIVKCKTKPSRLPEMRMRARFSKATPQILKVSLTEHAVFEEGKLMEEHLRHLGH